MCPKMCIMQSRLKESELVLAPDGTPYHIRLNPQTLSDNVILVGDPARVGLISKRFDKIISQTSNREIVSCTGMCKGRQLTVISTGMGVGCLDIVVTELDICANIDLETRSLKPKHRSLNLIRIGTCGSLQEDLNVGDCVVSRYVIGTDGLAYYYKDMERLNCNELTEKFVKEMQWKKNLPTPYALEVDSSLLNKLATGLHQGITVTAAGFYGPQGRQIRLPLADEAIEQRLKSFSFKGFKITNYEMETSALYALGTMLGHKPLTLCNVIAGRTNGNFSKDYHRSMEDLIDLVLDRI